jgi:hypothetical protein
LSRKSDLLAGAWTFSLLHRLQNHFAVHATSFLTGARGPSWLQPCINDIKHFIVQLIHTMLKKVELLKHFKIKEAVPTRFGLQGNHHQGATDST